MEKKYFISKIVIRILLFAVFFCSSFCGKSQIIKVPLQSMIGLPELMMNATTPVLIQKNETSDYRGFSNNFHAYGIGFSVFQKDQYYYERFKNDRKNGNTYLEKLKVENKDTLALSPQKVKCYVGIFVGLIGSKKKIIVDANNNHDFSDDASVEYDTITVNKKYAANDSLSLAPTFNIKYEIYLNGTVYPQTIALKILPYHSDYGYRDKLQADLNVYTVFYQQKKGTFTHLDKQYKVALSNVNSRTDPSFEKFFVNIQLVNMNFQRINFVKRNTVLNVDKSYFQPLNCSILGDTLYVKYWGFKENPTGWQVGNLLPEMESTDSTQKKLKLNNLWDSTEKKFLLLDFWGSWCRPCIEAIPELSSFYEKNAKDIKLISVAFEYNMDDFTKTKKIIENKKMNWTHLMELNNQDKGIINDLNIQSYPTLILVNSDGTILAREVGSGGINKINEVYKKYIQAYK